MDNDFDIQVTTVERPEFMQASHQLGVKYFLPLVLMVALVTVGITVFTQEISLRAFVPPVVLLILVPMIYQLVCAQNYKHFPHGSVQMDYHFSPTGWSIQMGESKTVVAWGNTAKVQETKDAFLLYNTKVTSNLLPKRLLTPDQQAQIRQWSNKIK